MQENLSESEIEFCEFYSDPTALTECLIPRNDSSPQIWPNGSCIVLRPYQFAMQNYSYLIAEDPDLPDSENRKRQKWSGDLASIGARNLGKSFSLKIDTVLSIIKNVIQGCLGSYDYKHLNKIGSEIADYVERHKFLKIFHLKDSRQQTAKRKDGVQIVTEHGTQIYSINENTNAVPDKRGEGFWGLHYDILWYEEISGASEEGTLKRVDSGNSIGYIERPSGIPDLCVGSPLGKILMNNDRKNWIWTLPQYVRQDFTDETEKKLIEEYSGKDDPQYQLNVEAKMLEGAFGFWDMDRLQEASMPKGRRRKLKKFEISKETFDDFESILHIERPEGIEQVYIASDVGFGAAPSEIVIIFYDGKEYRWDYNITLRRLLQPEQAKVNRFLYEKLGGAFISADASSDEGAMFDHLTDLPAEHLLRVKFNRNIEVDYDRDEQTGEILTDRSGKPLLKEMNTRDLAFLQLPKLMYSGQMNLAYDEKFLQQFTYMMAYKMSNNKYKYAVRTGENHLHSAFEVFAVSHFYNESSPLRNQKRVRRGFYSFGTEGN